MISKPRPRYRLEMIRRMTAFPKADVQNVRIGIGLMAAFGQVAAVG